ncbi:MAG: hypothetical protein ACREAA_12515 [Candidatus Polarisedimenticolia bacterium]
MKTPDEEILTRLVVHDIQAESFQMERETSRDGGKTWVPEEKITYKKR